jgi:multiple sugar transport system substrate-binding protein
MQALVDRFNREEPRIDVAMNVILWNDFYQKVPAAVYSGNGPDVGVMQVDQIPINAAHQITLTSGSRRSRRCSSCPSCGWC